MSWAQLHAKIGAFCRFSDTRGEPLTDREELNYKAIANAMRWSPNAELYRCILCSTYFLDYMGCKCPKSPSVTSNGAQVQGVDSHGE